MNEKNLTAANKAVSRGARKPNATADKKIKGSMSLGKGHAPSQIRQRLRELEKPAQKRHLANGSNKTVSFVTARSVH